MTKAQIRRKTYSIIDKANKQFGINLSKPNVIFFDNGEFGGYADSDYHYVSFNLKLAARDPAKFIKEVIIHEVAHLYTDHLFPNASTPHGREFKHVVTQLGGIASATHTL